MLYGLNCLGGYLSFVRGIEFFSNMLKIRVDWRFCHGD